MESATIDDDRKGHGRLVSRHRPGHVEDLDHVAAGRPEKKRAEKLPDHRQLKNAPEAHVHPLHREQHPPAPRNNQQDRKEPTGADHQPIDFHGFENDPELGPIDLSHKESNQQDRNQSA
jgi:hypothetical protein